MEEEGGGRTFTTGKPDDRGGLHGKIPWGVKGARQTLGKHL